MSKRKIAKSALIIGLATALSRIFGYIRDLVVAIFFGTGLGAEAFVVAFRIPNLLRNLVGEGAVNAALVPVFSGYLSVRSEEEFKNLAAALFSIFSVILIAIVTLGIVFTPLIVRLIAPGFLDDAYKYSLTIQLTRILFPYILLIGLGAWCMAILHSFKIFAPSSFGPVFLNISIISSVLLLKDKLPQPALSLAIGGVIGGILQLAIQVPPLIRKGIRFKFVWKLAREGVIKIGKLLLPRAIGTAVYQLNVFIDTILASLAAIVGQGAVAALYFSNRIIQLPMGLFAISLATAALPTMSMQAARGETKNLKETLTFSLEGVLLIMLPAMAGIFVLARPVTKLLFEWGAFGGYSTDITATALFFYAFGLFAYAGTKILVGGFYAMQDTVTPLKVAAKALFINIAFNLILMWKLKIGGLALATSIASVFNFGMLFFIINKRLGGLGLRKILRTTFKILVCSVIMGIFSYFLFFKACNFCLMDLTIAKDITRLILTIILSVSVFIFCASAFRVEQIGSLRRWILRRK